VGIVLALASSGLAVEGHRTRVEAQGLFDALFGPPKRPPGYLHRPGTRLRPPGPSRAAPPLPHTARPTTRGSFYRFLGPYDARTRASLGHPAPNLSPPPRPLRRVRTICVRMCDGYYWPMEFATPMNQLGRVENDCRASCAGEVGLFHLPATSDEIGDAVDREGQRYSALPTAFRYRNTRVADCSCRPPPWSRAELARHAGYEAEALAERNRKAAEAAAADAAKAGEAPRADEDASAGDAVDDAERPVAVAEAGAHTANPPVRASGPSTATATLLDAGRLHSFVEGAAHIDKPMIFEPGSETASAADEAKPGPAAIARPVAVAPTRSEVSPGSTPPPAEAAVGAAAATSPETSTSPDTRVDRYTLARRRVRHLRFAPPKRHSADTVRQRRAFGSPGRGRRLAPRWRVERHGRTVVRKARQRAGTALARVGARRTKAR
jgi:hypothetical protein